MLTIHRCGLQDFSAAIELMVLFVKTLFCQLWDHHVYVCCGQMMGQISPKGFHSLEPSSSSFIIIIIIIIIIGIYYYHYYYYYYNY